MKNINKATVLGFLGQDPLIREVGNGSMAQLRVATNESWKDKSGERVERTEWHNVEVWIPAMVDMIQRNLHKGSKVYIEGQLQTRKWEDREGRERVTTSISVRPFTGCLIGLDMPAKDSESRYESEASSRPSKPAPKAPSKAEPVFDDGIPF